MVQGARGPDDEASEASTANDDSWVMDETDEESDVLVALRLENEELKRVNRESRFGSLTRPAPAEPALLPPSSPAQGESRPNAELINTLTDFGLGNDSGDAAVRALAAGMSQPAAPASPPPPPTTTQTSWAPFSAVERTKTQAGQFLYLLNAAEGLKALDPYWGQKFWQAVARFDNHAKARGDFVLPDILMLFQSHGYVGEQTIAPPRGTLRVELESVRDVGAPQHGAGLAGLPGAQATEPLGLANEISGTAWHTRLPPDLRRAAPEIYRSLRAAGSASVRDWLNVQFAGNRNSPEWTALWHTASEVDFAVGKARDDAAVVAMLATSDLLEMGLRQLASHVYESRTHDRSGARAMLAVAAPGASVDIAPSWHVADCTRHSKVEHQRDERVQASYRARGRGGNRGRGGGGGGAFSGGGGGGAAPSGDATAGAADSQDRGRGRGRRGRGRTQG